MAFYVKTDNMTRGSGSGYVAFSPEDVLNGSRTRGFDDFLYQLKTRSHNLSQQHDKTSTPIDTPSLYIGLLREAVVLICQGI